MKSIIIDIKTAFAEEVQKFLDDGSFARAEKLAMCDGYPAPQSNNGNGAVAEVNQNLSNDGQKDLSVPEVISTSADAPTVQPSIPKKTYTGWIIKKNS